MVQYTAGMHGNASLRDIVAHLDELLDVGTYADEPDSNGLLFDTGQNGVSLIAVAVSTSLASIAGAARAGAQLLVVHHPPWAAIDLHMRDEKLEALRATGLSLYGAHASLDCGPAPVGNQWALARLLGVAGDTPFCAYHGGFAGVIGSCGGTFGDLISGAARSLGVQPEAHEHAKSFGRVAVVPGGGGETGFLDEARRGGADTYVTGEGSMFTRMFAKEARMNLLFATHYATEAPGIKALGAQLGDYARLPWTFIEESPDVF